MNLIPQRHEDTKKHKDECINFFVNLSSLVPWWQMNLIRTMHALTHINSEPHALEFH
jgi:hypothetical protein